MFSFKLRKPRIQWAQQYLEFDESEPEDNDGFDEEEEEEDDDDNEDLYVSRLEKKYNNWDVGERDADDPDTIGMFKNVTDFFNIFAFLT